ncbi:3496_t:CDS:1 [Ambispora leptoticha]|uniref:3496_t:CDS:1 n=1 Tax=Ambispora leptoticha TaxID=144679 RepID=A0A9N9GPF1_9GLOM|nr:3496_t:CDS:1 [Ambispora leptoticha]
MSLWITNQDTNQEKQILVEFLEFYDDATYRGWNEDIIHDVKYYISRVICKSEREIFQLVLNGFPKEITTKATLTRQEKLHASFVGFCYHFEIGTSSNQKKAIQYYRIAADHGDGFALSQMGLLFINDYTKYVEYIHKSARTGHPHGAYKMAILTSGRSRAFWYLKAAEKNFPHGLTKAAQFYKMGEYVNTDVHCALRMTLLVRRAVGEKDFPIDVLGKIFR